MQRHADAELPRLATTGRGRSYHRTMARGWESKSVEDQVEQRSSQTNSGIAENPDPRTAAARTTRERERQALELQRERILDERTSNPLRRQALEAALAEIEARLAKLG